MKDDDVMDRDRLWAPRATPASRAPERSAETERPGAGLDDLPDTARYEAFKAVDRDQFCLSIYTNGNPADVHPAYQYYQYVADDGRGNIFDIVFGFFVVRVRGRNLLPIVHAIKSKKCVFLQQYQHRAEWPEPGKAETVITKIEIVHQPSARVAMFERGGLPEKA